MAYGKKSRPGNRYRRQVPAKKSRRLFSRTAKRVHRRNGGGTRSMMRGGIRL